MKRKTKNNIIYNLCLFGTLLFLLFGIYSCVDVNSRQQERTLTQEVYEKVVDKVEKEVLSDTWMEQRIKVGWYKGHEYLLYESGHRGGIVHSPDCPCQKEK